MVYNQKGQVVERGLKVGNTKTSSPMMTKRAHAAGAANAFIKFALSQGCDDILPPQLGRFLPAFQFDLHDRAISVSPAYVIGQSKTCNIANV